MAEPDLSYTEFDCVECGGDSVDIRDGETVAAAVVRHYQDEHGMLE